MRASEKNPSFHACGGISAGSCCQQDYRSQLMPMIQKKPYIEKVRDRLAGAYYKGIRCI